MIVTALPALAVAGCGTANNGALDTPVTTAAKSHPAFLATPAPTSAAPWLPSAIAGSAATKAPPTPAAKPKPTTKKSPAGGGLDAVRQLQGGRRPRPWTYYRRKIPADAWCRHQDEDGVVCQR
jgi:hypothetical protein